MQGVMASVIRTMFASRWRIQTLAVVILLALAIHTLRSLRDVAGADADNRYSLLKWLGPFHSKPEARPPFSLPPEYDQFLERAVPQSDFCTERFTPKFLDGFRTHAIQYCAAGSPASLHCFHSHTRDDGRTVDSLCIGQGARLDVARQTFALDCQVRRPDSDETSRGLIPFDAIRTEWYDSGPRWVLDHWVRAERDPSKAAAAGAAGGHGSPEFILLVKRECSTNIWHCMMEIWSMTMTFDLLRTTPDPSRDGDNSSYFADGPDLPNTQLVILDEHDDGNFLDLWTIFTRKPLIRFKHLLSNPEHARAFAETPRNIIIPLAGAANPVWQNDWVDRECRYAPMLYAFVDRVLRFYGLPSGEDKAEAKAKANPVVAAHSHDASPPMINLTYIDRTGNRRLLDHDKLLAAVVAKYPHVRAQSVDLATLSFAEQLRLVRETDILLGVHGAGLTHTMFMRNGHGAVVEIRPASNDYRGFKNLAFMKGLHYFTAHGEQVPVGRGGGGEQQKPKRGIGARVTQSSERGGNQTLGLEKRDSWHWDDVRIGAEEFMGLMDAAISSLSSNPHTRRY